MPNTKQARSMKSNPRRPDYAPTKQEKAARLNKRAVLDRARQRDEMDFQLFRF